MVDWLVKHFQRDVDADARPLRVDAEDGCSGTPFNLDPLADSVSILREGYLGYRRLLNDSFLSCICKTRIDKTAFPFSARENSTRLKSED